MHAHSDAYAQTIANRKAPKNPAHVRTILLDLLTGCKRGMSSEQISDRLNEVKHFSLTNLPWTANNVQMAILHAVSGDETKSLSRGLAELIREGKATEDDFTLLQSRCTKSQKLLH